MVPLLSMLRIWLNIVNHKHLLYGFNTTRTKSMQDREGEVKRPLNTNDHRRELGKWKDDDYKSGEDGRKTDDAASGLLKCSIYKSCSYTP